MSFAGLRLQREAGYGTGIGKGEAGQIGRLLAPGGRVLISDPVSAQEKQTFTHMAFPFAPNPEYAQLYRKITDRDRRLYDMAEKNGTIWVRNIVVGNTVFGKGKIGRSKQ